MTEAVANPLRGEVALPLGGGTRLLRPTFGALVAAESEAGSLFQLLDRAAAGDVRMADIGAVFWHCLGDRTDGETRETFEAALLADGLGRLLPVYRAVLAAAFRGGG